MFQNTEEKVGAGKIWKDAKAVEQSLGSVLKNKPQSLALLGMQWLQMLLTNLQVLPEEFPSPLHVPKCKE